MIHYQAQIQKDKRLIKRLKKLELLVLLAVVKINKTKLKIHHQNQRGKEHCASMKLHQYMRDYKMNQSMDKK